MKQIPTKGSLHKRFTAKLQKSLNKGGWTYLVKTIGKDAGDQVTVRLEERI